MEIKGFAQNLANYMAKLSEKYYQNEWMELLEFELWRDLTEEPELLDEEEVEKLRNRSEACDGWIKMNYNDGSLEFLSLAEWKEFFKVKNPF